MMRRVPAMLLAALSLALSLPTGAAIGAGAAIETALQKGGDLGRDWPGWRGPDRDGTVRGFQAPETWPDALERGWSVEVGTGHSTPALVGGRLYVHARQEDHEVILALDATTGEALWRDRYPAPYEMDPTATEHGKGPKSSVTVSDGRVFTLGIDGVLSGLDAETGKVLWRHDDRERFPKPSPQYGAAMTPLVIDGLCIAHLGGDEDGAIVAFEVATGKPRWSWDGDGPAYASPVVATFGGKRQIITQTQFHAVGLDPASGALLWKIEYKTNFDQNSVTPVVAGDLLLLSGYHRGLDAYRVKGDGLEPVWSTTKVSLYMSTPVVREDRVFGFSEKRRGQIVCVDARSGDVLWTGDGREGENAALVAAGDLILALDTEAELIVLRAAGEYEELARYEVADTPTWAHPVVSGRTIFVKDERSLTRWTVPSGRAKEPKKSSG